MSKFTSSSPWDGYFYNVSKRNILFLKLTQWIILAQFSLWSAYCPPIAWAIFSFSASVNFLKMVGLQICFQHCHVNVTHPDNLNCFFIQCFIKVSTKDDIAKDSKSRSSRKENGFWKMTICNPTLENVPF